VFVISLFAWRGVARLVRGEGMKLRGQEFADAARALGATDLRILARHLVPNTLAPVIVAATLIGGGAILTEAALSVLGLGIAPPAGGIRSPSGKGFGAGLVEPSGVGRLSSMTSLPASGGG